MPSDLIITPNRSTGNPKMDFYDASSNLDASITLNVSNGDLEFALPGGGKIVLGNASQNVQIGGNLTVNGTTTTINSTTTTVDDPIFTLGGDTAPGSDDNKDRGIEFRWHNGTVAKVGFFGYDDSTGKFTFIPDATNTSEVFSGTKGTIDANIEWNDILNKPASSGTVTQIDTNNGITGGPITTTGTVGLTGQALALHNLATNGLIARTGSGTVAGRSIAQGTGISVSNGDGVSGNPTVGVDSTVALRADTHFIGTTSVALNRASANLALTGISSVTLPGATSGTVLLQPAATAGTTTITLPATTGTVVTTGDSGTVTSTMIADGTIVNGDINASAAIAITKLAASTISGISLGNNLATLTISTGLTGTSYNGSTAVTIGIDSSVVTTTGSQTLTNKTFTDSTTLFQDETDNTKKLAFQLSGITSGQTRTLTIPNNSGTIALTSDITGGTPGGSNTQVQFNNNGAFGGDSGFTFDATNDSVGITSASTTVSPFIITATALNDGVGALRINGVEPDLNLNDTDGGFNTITFENNGAARVAIGRDSGNAAYIAVRDPAVSGGAWKGDALVINSSTGNATFGYDLGVNGGDITTTATTATIFNATATTLSMGGAATNLTIGGATGGSALNIGTGATISGQTKNINIGTGGVSGSTTNIYYGTNTAGAVSQNIFNGFCSFAGGALELAGTPDTMTAGYAYVNNNTSGNLNINSGFFGAAVVIGDVDGNQANNTIYVDVVNGVTTISGLFSIGSTLTFGDGSVQATKTPDFILFDLGII